MYRIRETSSYESMFRIIIRIAAALSGRTEWAELGGPWEALYAKGRGLRDKRDDAALATARAEALQRVLDAFWDAKLADISGHAFLVSGKRNDHTPYVDLFGAVTANEARSLGAYRASVFGEDLLAKMRKLANPALASYIEPFAKLNAELAAAGEARLAAERAERLLALDQDAFRLELETQLARTEVALLGRLIGNPAAKQIVAAVLDPEPSRRKEEEPAQPAPAVT